MRWACVAEWQLIEDMQVGNGKETRRKQEGVSEWAIQDTHTHTDRSLGIRW